MYKRQVENGKKKKIKCPWVSILMTPKVENLNDAKDYDILVAVSYTHLDVYKRQVFLKRELYLSHSVRRE